MESSVSCSALRLVEINVEARMCLSRGFSLFFTNPSAARFFACSGVDRSRAYQALEQVKDEQRPQTLQATSPFLFPATNPPRADST